MQREHGDGSVAEAKTTRMLSSTGANWYHSTLLTKALLAFWVHLPYNKFYILEIYAI